MRLSVRGLGCHTLRAPGIHRQVTHSEGHSTTKKNSLVIEGYHVLPGGFFFGKLRPEEVLGIALGPSGWLE